MLKILDIGSGPTNILGEKPGVGILHCDRKDFSEQWRGKGRFEIQDMEHLTYPDNSFDFVHCVNALDHTKDVKAAIKEMIRVCRGYIYIDCALDQLTTSGGWHYWDAKEDGLMISKNTQFNLKDYGFSIDFIDNGGERRYNHIIAIKQCFQ